MSIQLSPVAITGTPFQIDNKNIPIDRMGWIEFLNESLYTLQLQMGSININIPAWYNYPIQIQKVVNGIWQNTSGALLPIKISPVLLPASSSAQSASLLTTVYNTGETPSITTPQPLVRQTFIPNTVGTQVATLSNESNSSVTLIIDIGQTGNAQLITINSDGSGSWSVLRAGVAHKIFTINSGGVSPLQIGQVGDSSEVLGKLFVDGLSILDGGGITTDGIGNVSLSKTTFTTGSISRINGGNFNGTLSGATINHGLGVTPDVVIATPNVAQPGSAQVGIGNINATSFQITTSSGVNVMWLAIKF